MRLFIFNSLDLFPYVLPINVFIPGPRHCKGGMKLDPTRALRNRRLSEAVQIEIVYADNGCLTTLQFLAVDSGWVTINLGVREFHRYL